jgi:hypothetical protein
LQPLPDFHAVNLPDWLSGESFGDFVSVLEFFWSFGDLLSVKEYHTSSRVTFDDLMQAITSRETTSPLTDLFNILLRAKADRGDEEDGDEGQLRVLRLGLRQRWAPWGVQRVHNVPHSA